MSERIVVVGNGKWPSERVWSKLIADADKVVALDGAADRINCDIVIGDLDSWSGIGEQEVIKLDGQDDTDLAKALKRFDVSDVFGIEGGRLDHSLAAFTALFEADSNATIHLEGWSGCRVPVDGAKIEVDIGANVSLFAFGKVTAIHTSGLLYSLGGEDMETSTLGVHNEATDNHVKISHQGVDLLAIWQTNIVD